MEWADFNLRQDFISGHQPSANPERSFHIVISDDELLAIDNGEPWRPLDQDEWRWLGLTAVAEHCLGEVGGIPVFATEVEPDVTGGVAHRSSPGAPA